MEVVIMIIGIIIVLVTSIWVLFDAKKLMNNTNIDARKSIAKYAYEPMQWFGGCLIVWIVYFPLYLSKRNQYKALRK